MNFDEDNWRAYREANWLFAHAVRSVLRPGDCVWVQDYHLMLLPLMLTTILEHGDIERLVPKECSDMDVTSSLGLKQVPGDAFDPSRASHAVEVARWSGGRGGR